MSLGIVVIVVVAVVVAGLLVARGRQRPEPAVGLPSAAERNMPPRETGKMLRSGADACVAAQALTDCWYPEGSTPPRLPLKDCPQAQTCRCQWVREADRRVEHRRSGHDRRGAVRFVDKPDRRSGHDRRKDLDDFWKGG